MGNVLIDRVGKRYGRLVVLEPAGYKTHGNGKRRSLWLCKCDCGALHTTMSKHLVSGEAASCGCLQREQARKQLRSHGLSYQRVYKVWVSMKGRCHNPADMGFKNYGARGITVCERWQNSFENFHFDMGPRPAKHSIERKDNNKGYSPDNCVWATKSVQCNNNRRNIFIEHRGERLTLMQWAKKLGFVYGTLRQRLRNGWPPEKILTEPVRQRHPLA